MNCFIVETTDDLRTVAALREAFASDLSHHQAERIMMGSEIAVVADDAPIVTLAEGNTPLYEARVCRFNSTPSVATR